MQAKHEPVNQHESGKPCIAESSSSKNDSKRSWQENHANESLSGIEFRKVKSNELINFIVIKHDEILDKSSSFRIAVIVGDDGNTFALPPKQTFEEMIQAKRRQQMLLYGAGNFSTGSSSLSERAARRVAAMARRQSSLNVALNRQNSETPATGVSKSSKSSRSRSGKKPSTRSSASRKSGASRASISKSMPKPIDPTTPSTSGVSKSATGITPVVMNTSDESIATSDTSNNKLITSMKELARQNPTLAATDKKQIKSLLKSAAPGASIVLSNGTVIKKSRRGGARAGAGRKRNRPAQNGQFNTSSSSRDERDTGDESRGTSQQDNDSTNHSLASLSNHTLAT